MRYRLRYALRGILRETEIEGLGLDDLLGLGAFTKKPGASAEWVGELKGRGRSGERLLGRRRVDRAVGRLLLRGLLRAAPEWTDEGPQSSQNVASSALSQLGRPTVQLALRAA